MLLCAQIPMAEHMDLFTFVSMKHLGLSACIVGSPSYAGV